MEIWCLRDFRENTLGKGWFEVIDKEKKTGCEHLSLYRKKVICLSVSRKKTYFYSKMTLSLFSLSFIFRNISFKVFYD